MSASKPERAVKLREAGLTYSEIARYLGVGYATAYRWINPDYAERHRAVARRWKQNNKGACVECGAPTDVSDGGQPRERCAACWNRRYAEQRKLEMRSRMDEAIYWRSQGLTNIEVGERMDVSAHSIADLLSKAKRRGLTVPRSPYWDRAA